MKRLLVLSLSFIIFFATSCRKEKLYWEKIVQLESHTTARLNRIQFVNGTGIIGGGEKYLSAEILKSTDGGNTWTHTSYPEAGKGMYGLGVSPSGKVYMSAFDGKVLSSADLINWQVHQVNDWRYYVALAFPTEDKGFLVATGAQEKGNIVRVNSALQIQDTVLFPYGLNDVLFTSENTGYVTGYGAVLKTTDGGNNWKLLDIKHDNFKAIHSIDANNLWICGQEGSIFHTTDAGSTWQRVRNGNTLGNSKYRLQDIVFKDEKHGWAVGDKGAVIYTSDGGNNWKPYNSFTTSSLLTVAIAPDGNLVVAGENGSLYKLYL